MTLPTDRAATPDQSRARLEDLLLRYPDLTKDELRDLLHRLRKETSIYDAAILASSDTLKGPYARVRAEHLDKLSPAEKAGVWIVGAVALGAVAGAYLLL